MGKQQDLPNHNGNKWLEFWIFYNIMAKKNNILGQLSELYIDSRIMENNLHRNRGGGISVQKIEIKTYFGWSFCTNILTDENNMNTVKLLYLCYCWLEEKVVIWLSVFMMFNCWMSIGQTIPVWRQFVRVDRFARCSR